jgi:hypothetical protein
MAEVYLKVVFRSLHANTEGGGVEITRSQTQDSVQAKFRISEFPNTKLEC